jgi:vesicle coat complex subunit
VLAKLLTDDDPAVRAAAAHGLGEIGAAVRDINRKVVPKLVEMLRDREPGVRAAAEAALKKIDPRGRR